MGEVDRLSNSGLYPTLPIADRQRREGSDSKPPPDRGGGPAGGKPDDARTADAPRPPKSRIDEYA